VKKENHKILEQHEGEIMMTELSFLGKLNCPFNIVITGMKKPKQT